MPSKYAKYFEPLPHMPGEGRCRVCDLPYSLNLPHEVRDHAAFHRRYEAACDGVNAPVPRGEREKLLEDAFAMQQSSSLDVRVEGGDKWVLAKYHYYLFEVLLYDVKRRLDLREFFTQRLEDRGLVRGNFAPDVAYALRFRYSDHPMYD